MKSPVLVALLLLSLAVNVAFVIGHLPAFDSLVAMVMGVSDDWRAKPVTKGTKPLCPDDPQSLVACLHVNGFPPELIRSVAKAYVDWKYDPARWPRDPSPDRVQQLAVEKARLLESLNRIVSRHRS